MKINGVETVLQRPSRTYRVIEFFSVVAAAIVILLLVMAFVCTPIAIGLGWYYLTHDALSGALIGIVCGGIADFFYLVLLKGMA